MLSNIYGDINIKNAIATH